jgi:L-lactate dehydrogenase complex protein LldE
MLREVYPELLPEAAQFSGRVKEFSQFVESVPCWRRSSPGPQCVTYHPSCHLLRGLHVDAEPKRVLGRIEGLSVKPLEMETECCGFGGSFSARYPEVSSAMLVDKLHHFEHTGADAMVVAEIGCMLHLENGLQARASKLRVLHIAELLEQAEASGDGG